MDRYEAAIGLIDHQQAAGFEVDRLRLGDGEQIQRYQPLGGQDPKQRLACHAYSPRSSCLEEVYGDSSGETTTRDRAIIFPQTEREGFEPPVPLRALQFSRLVP